MDANQILDRLEKVENLAAQGRLNRFLHRPLNYIVGMGFTKFWYPVIKLPFTVHTSTITGHRMEIKLPGALDIYLLGAKSHDSEIRLAKWMILNLDHQDSVIDIGGHYGFYSLLAASLGCKVIGLEASPSTFRVYRSNVGNIDLITPKNVAVSSVEKDITFYEFPVLYAEYNTINPDQFMHSHWLSKNPPKEIRVAGQPLDLLCAEIQDHPTFVKIDVEGAEEEVIKGMSGLLRKAKPVISMEYLISERNNTSHISAAKILQEHSYTPYIIDKDGRKKEISFIETAITERGLDSDNILFIPDSSKS